MESQIIVCEACGTRLKVPATIAPGKKVKCSKCAGVVTVSAAEAGYAIAGEPPAATAKPRTAQARGEAANTKPCPYCGEQILDSAVKCRHCGEFLDPQHAPSHAPSRRGFGGGDTSGDLNPSEYFVGIIAAPIGLIIGIVWALRKLPKAKQMLKVSGVCMFTLTAIGFGVWQYKTLSNQPGLPTASFPPGYQPPPPIEDYSEPDVPFMPPGGRLGGEELSKVKVDLTGQPPHIQRAMRSVVFIQSTNSLGSGVVIQRDGRDALIITNRHVVDVTFAMSHGAAKTELKDLPYPKIYYLNVEQDAPGKVLWVADEGVDLALVRASCPDEIEPVPWQASGRVLQGEPVFAIGHPIGLSWTMTKGVVSALRQENNGSRVVPTIQTDTAITHGNSGGGLYNDQGMLIGINTFIVNPALAKGLGFSIRTTFLSELKPSGLTIPDDSASGIPQ